jgi:hypothetical protein
LLNNGTDRIIPASRINTATVFQERYFRKFIPLIQEFFLANFTFILVLLAGNYSIPEKKNGFVTSFCHSPQTPQAHSMD